MNCYKRYAQLIIACVMCLACTGYTAGENKRPQTIAAMNPLEVLQSFFRARKRHDTLQVKTLIAADSVILKVIQEQVAMLPIETWNSNRFRLAFDSAIDHFEEANKFFGDSLSSYRLPNTGDNLAYVKFWTSSDQSSTSPMEVLMDKENGQWKIVLSYCDFSANDDFGYLPGGKWRFTGNNMSFFLRPMLFSCEGYALSSECLADLRRWSEINDDFGYSAVMKKGKTTVSMFAKRALKGIPEGKGCKTESRNNIECDKEIRAALPAIDLVGNTFVKVGKLLWQDYPVNQIKLLKQKGIHKGVSGVLYANTVPNIPKIACPDGWRIPKTSEWRSLFQTVEKGHHPCIIPLRVTGPRQVVDVIKFGTGTAFYDNTFSSNPTYYWSNDALRGKQDFLPKLIEESSNAEEPQDCKDNEVFDSPGEGTAFAVMCVKDF